MAHPRYWAIACGTLLIKINRLDVFQFGGSLPSNAEWVAAITNMISRDWGITSPNEARSTIQDLLTAGHRAECRRLCAELDQTLATVHTDHGFRAQSPRHDWVARNRQLVTGKSLVAWDACRAVCLAGWSYLAGYLPEAEAWGYAMAAARACQQTYGSWQELGEHYVYGYQFWGGQDSTSLFNEVQGLVRDPQSPWSLMPWQMALDAPDLPVAASFVLDPVPPAPVPGQAPVAPPQPVAAKPAGFFGWLGSLFGGGKASAAQPDPAATQAHWQQGGQQGGQLSEAERQRIFQQQVGGAEDIEGIEHLRVHGTGAGARVIRHADGADLVEDDGEVQWVDRQPNDLPADQWRDDWGPLRGQGQELVNDFVYHDMVFDQTRAGDPNGAEQRLLGFGYASVGQFFRVRATVLKHFGENHGPLLSQRIYGGQTFTTAALKASQRMQQDKGAAVLAGNPSLLEPIEGVSLEVYAMLTAKVSTLSEAEFQQLLAQHGLDLPRWLKANSGWTERMQNDTTATVATKFSEAFMAAGAGAYGAAAQAAAATGFDGSAAAGAEPMPFERYCELAGAMAAWSTIGVDVNSAMQQKFGVSALDYANISSWWFTKMMADMTLMNTYNQKMEYYQKQYAGQQPNVTGGISF